jgi:hypothetical protein
MKTRTDFGAAQEEQLAKALQEVSRLTKLLQELHAGKGQHDYDSSQGFPMEKGVDPMQVGSS